ncbi:cation:proton antiporter [Streptomyces sp. NPDC006290]|uniref:cation:proton antiporter n=1 Tax=Streptomyces sp. NPDC006290 TaxID=3156745 RepID=UPI0033A1B531
MRSVGTVVALVVLATMVATFARRWRIPAPSLLVVAGLAVALLPGTPQIEISPEIIGLVVLPPLLYASAEELSWRELKVVWKPVGVLSIGLVLASAAAVGAVASLVTPLSWQMAFVLGAVLASTDPVAVTALGRRLALPPKVQMLVQAESLFNDATSLVLFRVAVSLAVASAAANWGAAGGEFVLLAGGGTVIGAALAGVVTLIRRRTEDPVLETVIALVTPYAAYILAEAAHTSGVTSVVVAGVVLGGRGDRLTNARIRLQLHAVYGTVVFLLESVVFSLIGLALPAQVQGARPAGAALSRRPTAPERPRAGAAAARGEWPRNGGAQQPGHPDAPGATGGLSAAHRVAADRNRSRSRQPLCAASARQPGPPPQDRAWFRPIGVSPRRAKSRAWGRSRTLQRHARAVACVPRAAQSATGSGHGHRPLTPS